MLRPKLFDCHRPRGRLEREGGSEERGGNSVTKDKVFFTHGWVKTLTTAARFMSDLAERERGAGAPFTQSETAVTLNIRCCWSRGLWVTGGHHVKLARSDPKKEKGDQLLSD